MALHTDIWRIINTEPVSTHRKDGRPVIRDSVSFRALDQRKQDTINRYTENRVKELSYKAAPDMITLEELKRKTENTMKPLILNAAVRDSFPGGDIGRAPGYFPNGGNMGGVYNPVTGAGTSADPSAQVRVTPNLWLSAFEASSIYSQKGIPELIVKKKSQSIIINGVRIRNKYFTPDQLDKIAENVIRLNFAETIAQSVNWSLVYGGSLVFPFFRKDTPVSMSLNIRNLIKYGIVGKGCIDRFVCLDRWNVVHIPQTNPTAADFLEPSWYFIPFLGCDVRGERCARIVTSPQAGYWGNMMTLGWGLSDFCGWYPAVLNYMSVMDTLTTMINQMSILVRSINVDGVLATEGELILDAIARQNTNTVRRSSNVNDPIMYDILGSLQAINRDYGEVPNLVRLMRQDMCAKANFPEEAIISSERGAFSSGDSTEGAMEKQLEAIKYVHKDVARQLKYAVYLLVIDALGLDRDVLKNLSYTTIEFDNPALTDAAKKARFFKEITEGYFNEVSGLMDASTALEIASAVGETDLPVSNELIEKVRARQEKLDAQADEKHKLEMELMKAQIQAAKNPAPAAGSSGGSKKGHSYDSRVEQKQHERVASDKKSFQRIQKRST